MAKKLMSRGLVGAVVLAFTPALAFAAPKAGAGGAAGVGSGSSVTPAGGAAPVATAPAPSVAPTTAPLPPAPVDPAASVAPPADPNAPPAEVAAAAPPAAMPPPPVQEEPAAGHRKKRHKRRHVEDRDEVGNEDEDEGEEDGRWVKADDDDVAVPTWSVRQTRFIVSAERLTSLASWSVTSTQDVPTQSQFSTTTTMDLEASGTDVSLLGGGGDKPMGFRNIYAVPRLAFDGRFSNGLTLGGSIGYIVLSGKHDSVNFNNTNIGTGVTKTSVTEPDFTTFIFAPRIGVLFPASPKLSVWLRGGVTRVSVAQEGGDDNGVSSSSFSQTITALAVTLDPQLVFTPIPHVGLTVGATFDIGASGSIDTSGANIQSTSHDFKASSYGVTAGLAALF